MAGIDPREALSHAVSEGHEMVLPQAAAVLEAGEGFVEEAHRAGAAVGTWTVDDEATLATLFAWAVDAVATNRPALAVEVRDRASR